MLVNPNSVNAIIDNNIADIEGKLLAGNCGGDTPGDRHENYMAAVATRRNLMRIKQQIEDLAAKGEVNEEDLTPMEEDKK